MGSDQDGDLKFEDGQVWEFHDGTWRPADLERKLPPLYIQPPDGD